MSELASTLAKEFADKDYAHGYVNEFGNVLIASQIKALREERGWSQERLAAEAGMAQERICKLENVDYDSWTLATLRKLAAAFDVTVGMKFEPFSQAILGIVNLTPEKLTVAPREQDLARFCESVLRYDDRQWWAVPATGAKTFSPGMTIQVSLPSDDNPNGVMQWQDLPTSIGE
jgi:transcriptional regulator with XRE-family HTH domain